MVCAIIGYGKMGREIEKILSARGHEVKLIIDENNSGDLNSRNLSDIDIAFEFSTPHTAYANITKCIENSVAVVSGTTGWLSELDNIIKLCAERQGAFFYASNFSIGVNITFKLSALLARMMNRFDEFDVTVQEVHHTQKLDAPSGTAITLAEGILDGLDRKKRWVNNTTTIAEELELTSVRRSVVPGIHEITYESATDIIQLSHTSKSRSGLASGAVLAGEFLCGKKGVYTMDDLLNL